jgi:hypothetical protein
MEAASGTNWMYCTMPSGVVGAWLMSDTVCSVVRPRLLYDSSLKMSLTCREGRREGQGGVWLNLDHGVSRGTSCTAGAVLVQLRTSCPRARVAAG